MHGKITMYKHRQLHSMAKVTLLTYFTLTIDKFFIIMFQTFFKFHFFNVSNFKKNFTNVFFASMVPATASHRLAI